MRRKYSHDFFLGVPKIVKQSYKQMQRREDYLEEKETLVFHDDYYFDVYQFEQYELQEQKRKLHNALDKALEEFEVIDPIGFQLVDEFFFGEKRFTFTEMGRRHKISRQAYTKMLNKHLKVLKSLILSCIDDEI